MGAPGDGHDLPAPVHVVVVHHDRPDDCARSVAAFEAQGRGVTVTVVDSSSRAASSIRLRQLLPDRDIVDAGANVGFGAGANIGWRHWLRHGTGQWVAVAPHDALPRPGCLATILAEVADRDDVGLVSAEFGDRFDLVPALDWVLGGYYLPAVRGTGWQDVDYAHGTLLLARRRTLEQIGLFDDRYFAYCEEVDLSMRARAAGWKVGLVWGAVVDNGNLPDPVVADYLQVRNTLLLVRSHFGRYATGVHAVLALGRLAGRVRRDPHRWRTQVRLETYAARDFVRGRFGPPPDDVTALSAASARPAGNTDVLIGPGAGVGHQ